MEPDPEIVAATLSAPAPRLPVKPSLPLVQELPRELTPWDAFLRLQGLPHVLFLDSAQKHPDLGRYSFLSGDPFDWLQARGRDVYLNGARLPAEAGNPFEVLASRLASFRAETVPGLPPFQGGAAGVFGYDLCHHLE